jgi:RNA polymerase sigma-70 factor (ECF subfamily)
MKSTTKVKKTLGVVESAGIAARNEILENFIRDYGKKAYRFAFRLSGNAEDARDLVQEALYRITLAWDRYDPAKSLEAWFFTVLRNTVMNSRRGAGRRNCVALDAPVAGEDGCCYYDVVSDGRGDVTHELEKTEAENAARLAVERLRPDYRAVIELWEMNGMQYLEIASSLGIPIGTVRSRLSRARRALQSDPDLAATAD